MSHPVEPFNIAVPDAALADLKRRARDDERTLSNYIRRLLKRAVQDDQDDQDR